MGKQEKQKMKKKNKISDSTCAKNKTTSKNKKKEKFASSRTEKPISNENVTDISSSNKTDETSSSSRTDYVLGNDIDDNLQQNRFNKIEFAVNDRVMKKVKNKTTNGTTLEGPYVVINYLAAVIKGNDDKVIIRKTSPSSFTTVYETLPVTKIVRYKEGE